jgi:hypothetical protein
MIICAGEKEWLVNNVFLKQLLEITEQHLLAEHSHENAQEYKRRLQELIGKALDEHPEYKERDEFKKLLKSTDEYLQKELSLKDDLKYCRELSKFLCDILGLWRIESISAVKAATGPTKKEMEKLLPSNWPSRWKEIDRYAEDGLVNVSLAHINPFPEDELGVRILKGGFGIATSKLSLKPEKFDFVAHLSIAGYADKQTARQFFESYQTIFTQGPDAPTPGASIDIPLGDLIKVFAPEELAGEMQSALQGIKEGFAKSGVRIEKEKYLGEEASWYVGDVGKRGCNAVLINNFVITGLLLAAPVVLEPGSAPIRGSTRKASGFIHREEVEQILRSIFSKIKGRKAEVKEVSAEITRGQTRVQNPREKFRVKNGDTIKTDKKTQVNIADSTGNKMWIEGGSNVIINKPSDFDLIIGSITAFIKSLKPKTKFEIHTPTATTGVRGTIFSVWTDKTTTSLTVVEGEVEFSDLKGNKTIVKSNQACFCSKDEGLQRPVTLPISVKAQFKRTYEI